MLAQLDFYPRWSHSRKQQPWSYLELNAGVRANQARGTFVDTVLFHYVTSTNSVCVCVCVCVIVQSHIWSKLATTYPLITFLMAKFWNQTVEALWKNFWYKAEGWVHELKLSRRRCEDDWQYDSAQ